jgi:hypothetical protein
MNLRTPLVRRTYANKRKPELAAWLFEPACSTQIRPLMYRMCPICPRCNADGSNAPCQDQFGSNARPMGGSLGLCHGGGGAVEFQKLTTPHFHGNMTLSSVYRFKTLKEIGELIEADLLTVEAITRACVSKSKTVHNSSITRAFPWYTGNLVVVSMHV